MKKISIEYSHIYSNKDVSEDQNLSVSILKDLIGFDNKERKEKSLVVMVDDYSFPDHSFDYIKFNTWLKNSGFEPDVVIRESQLIPYCDDVVELIKDIKIKTDLKKYIQEKRYPCSLFIATWYLIRLGEIDNNLLPESEKSKRLINILPRSFESFENKAFEIINSTAFKDQVSNIENIYFEGRLI